MDLKDVQPYIEDKVCMVTGGGGSIGSEIVRSLSKLNAEKIVIVDIYENGAYSVKCEVGRQGWRVKLRLFAIMRKWTAL